MDIITFIKRKILMRDLAKAMKPTMVWLYIYFEGDQRKIFDFLNDMQDISPEVVLEATKNVNLKDYITGYEETKMRRYCKKHHLDFYKTFVVKVR